MAVYKTRSGKWRAELFIGGTRLATRSGFERKTEALAWLNEARHTRARESQEHAPEFTFDALNAKFMAQHIPTLRPLTQKRYAVDISRRLVPFFKYYRLQRITPALLEEFKAEIQTKLSPKSVNNCLAVLRIMLAKAVRYGMLKESPYDLEPMRVTKQTYAWWEDKADIQRFLAVARTTRYFPVYLLALETGLRYSEIMGLSKGDIDFERGILTVRRQWHERLNQYGPTKGGEPRWVDFDPTGELAKVLRQACEASPHPEAVFVTANGKRPGKSGVADKYFRAIQKRAGVKRLRFHDLRHNFASWFMRERGDIWALKAILGHSDIKTTQRYAHHAQRERQKPLNLASAFPHESHTVSDLPSVTSGDRYLKEWRDGRDLNSSTPVSLVLKKAQ